MSAIDVGVTINADPSRVFALAADIPNVPKFIAAITRIEMLTPGPIGAGTRWRETRRAMGQEAAVELEISAFDPPRSMTISGMAMGSRYDTRFEIVPEGGGTRAEMHVDITPSGLLARIGAAMSKGMMRKSLKGDLDSLKVAAERAG